MKNLEFLRQQHPELADSEPVKRSVEKATRGGQKKRKNYDLVSAGISDEQKIDTHLERIERILEYKNLEGHNTAVGGLKRSITDQSVIKVYKKDGQENRKLLKEVSRNLFRAEKDLARAEGRGAEVSQIDEKLGELTGEERDSKLIEIYKQKIIEAQKIQRQGIEYWMNYLTSGDSNYPTWFKYLIIKAISKLGQLDEENLEFKKRFPQTLAPFPELNQEALGLVHAHITDNPDEEKDFNKLYAKYLVQVKNEKREAISDKGEWNIIAKGSDPKEAMARIQGFGTGWCISTNLADMEKYLANGDLHIFFSENEQSTPVIPRVCIYVENGNVKEIRGITANQNLEGRMTEIADKKKNELPGGSVYDKRSNDMRLLTTIDDKVKKKQKLDRDDLIFLYEINSNIEGFGFQKDPRIKELQDARNPKEDAAIILDCQPEEIAWNQDEITDRTKTYIGSLERGIFGLIQECGVEQVYASFLKGKVEIQRDCGVGPITLAEFQRQIDSYNLQIADESMKIKIYKIQDMAEKIGTIENPALKGKEVLTLVNLKVRDLFPNDQGYRGHVPQEIFQRADELGLELCPPEVAFFKRLNDVDQPKVSAYQIAMKPIMTSSNSRVFVLVRREDGSWLESQGSLPDYQFPLDSEFVFCLRKKDSKS